MRFIAHLRLALIIEAVGEEGPEFWGEVGGATFGFARGGAEIDKPILETACAIASSVSFIWRLSSILSSRAPNRRPMVTCVGQWAG